MLEDEIGGTEPYAIILLPQGLPVETIAGGLARGMRKVTKELVGMNEKNWTQTLQEKGYVKQHIYVPFPSFECRLEPKRTLTVYANGGNSKSQAREFVNSFRQHMPDKYSLTYEGE